MPTMTPHAGVRTTIEGIEKAPFIIADMSTIGGAFTAPAATVDVPRNEPFHFTTDDTEMIAAIGATGTLARTIRAINDEGVVASVVATIVDTHADADTQMGLIVGNSATKTGLWGLLDAQSQCGIEPDLLIAPGFTATRPGNAANPAATAIDAICDRIITAIGFCDTPSATKEDAVEWTADFANTMNLVAIGQGVRKFWDGAEITIDAAPTIAAHSGANDKRRGAPYYLPIPYENPLKGILGPSRSVGFSISDPDSEANYLIQRGVNSLVQIVKDRTSRKTNAPQGKNFWGFFTTNADPLWRAINVVRVRKAVREVIPRTLVRYMGRNLGPHLVTTIIGALDDFIDELEGMPEPPVLGHETKWERSLNSNATMRTGGLHITLNFEEAPPLTDLVVHTGRYEAAFDILADDILAAMATYRVAGELPSGA